jgi:hypothetical protein
MSKHGLNERGQNQHCDKLFDLIYDNFIIE